MGSSGSGEFGSYRIGNISKEGANNGIGGTGEVECPVLIENIRLEDVANSPFFISRKNIPVVNTKVQLINKIFKGRLVIATSDTNEIIGNMPVKYNYLINCINDKIYTGFVISSGTIPIPFVVVTLNV